MLVAGYDETYLNDTEIVDLSAVNRTCRNPADFPYLGRINFYNFVLRFLIS